MSYWTLPLYPTLSFEINIFINSICNFIIISTNCVLVAAKRHFTSINYDVIFSFDADRKLPTLCQQQNTFTLLLSVTIDATTTLLMSFGLGSFKFLDQNLTSGPERVLVFPSVLFSFLLVFCKKKQKVFIEKPSVLV